MIEHYIITTTNYNNTYYSFLPSIYRMWKQYIPNCKFVLGFVDDRKDNDKNNDFIKKLNNYSDELIIFKNKKMIDSGILAKTLRMYIATKYEKHICSVVDIDQYLLNFEWFQNKIKEAYNDKFVTIGMNLYSNTSEQGKFPMSFTTAKSFLWNEIINPNNLSYESWINYICNIKDPIDNKEFLTNNFNNFSDESLLRYLINRNLKYDRRNIIHCEIREDGKFMRCFKRVDRSNWNIDINKLYNSYYIDSQPLRPFNTNYENIKPLLQYMKIDNFNNFI